MKTNKTNTRTKVLSAFAEQKGNGHEAQTKSAAHAVRSHAINLNSIQLGLLNLFSAHCAGAFRAEALVHGLRFLGLYQPNEEAVVEALDDLKALGFLRRRTQRGIKFWEVNY